MHKTPTNSFTSETQNENSFWSYCFAIVSVFALADILSGGQIQESFTLHKLEYTGALFIMIATLGVFARDGSPRQSFVRTFSRQKL